MPSGRTVVTFVMPVVYLEADYSAAGARGTLMKPIAICIKTILYMIVINPELKCFSERYSLLPSGDFQPKKLEVLMIRAMTQKRV